MPGRGAGRGLNRQGARGRPAPPGARRARGDRQAPARRDGPSGLGGDQVEGRRAVRELLAAGRRQVRSVWFAQGLDPAPLLDEIELLAARRKVRVETVPRGRLDAAARTDAPQGVLARALPVEPVPLESLCDGPGAFLVVAAGITDPRNLGALLRSAECAGVTGVVLPRHRAAHLSPTVAKAAAGAIEHLDFALVGGVPSALVQLQELGVVTLGLAAEAGRSIYEVEGVGGPVALVVGGEERGLAPLVRRRCDEVVAIPQHGALPSLNAAVAAAVACFELSRRRGATGRTGPHPRARRPSLRAAGPVGRLNG